MNFFAGIVTWNVNAFMMRCYWQKDFSGFTQRHHEPSEFSRGARIPQTSLINEEPMNLDIRYKEMNQFFFVIVVVSLFTSTRGQAECPCSDTSLCEPLSQAAVNANMGRSIVFTNAPNSTKQGDNWDFEKIAAWAPFNHLGPNYPTAQDLYCKAHASNIPVYTWGYESYDGGSCPVTRFYGWALSGNANVYDKEATTAWAQETAACVVEKGFDGILLDMEGIGGPPLGPEEMLDAITFAVCTLKSELVKHLPYGRIYWTADTGPYYDYDTLTRDGCVDLWIDMAYDWCVANELNIDYRNRANSPLPYINQHPDSIVPMYTEQYNVPVNKLGIAFPWYGCQFNCTSDIVDGGAYLGCEDVVLLPGQPTYDWVQDGWLPTATTDVVLNETVTALYFNSVYDGSIQQVWYDDASTTAAKYNEALAAGVRYVGVWTVDMVDEHADSAKAFWDALPAPNDWR